MIKSPLCIAILLIIGITSCNKKDVVYSSDTKIIGHGGMGITHDYPINTFEAIAFALHKGVDGVEIDVQMTIDSVLVAYHHEQLEDEMEQTGSIYEKYWDEIRNEEYQELLYSEYGLVSLRDIFKHLPEYSDKTFFFDVKTFTTDTTGAYERRMVRRLLNVIKEYQLSNTIVEVPSEFLGQIVKSLMPEQRVFLYRNIEGIIDSCLKYEFQGINQDIDQYSLEEVRLAQDNGLEVSCINTHSKDRNDEAYRLGIEYNQTDMVNYVLRKAR
jgi:glycerophosphoryl diester phosphodiesterase